MFKVRFVTRFDSFGNLRLDSRFDSIAFGFEDSIRDSIRSHLDLGFDSRFEIRSHQLKNLDSISDSTEYVLPFMIRPTIRSGINLQQDST